MGAFTPFKRHANRFNYTPRYYDPAKEAREERRAELRGERSDDPSDGAEEYRPGKFIKRSAAARLARRGGDATRGGVGSRRMWISVVVVIAVAWMGTMLYAKILEVMGLTQPTRNTMVVESEEEEFDPYAPITIVPNDYDPSKEQ